MTINPGPSQFAELDFIATLESLPAPIKRCSNLFYVFKFVCDKGSALLALPMLVVISLVLLVVNPIFNPGPLFYGQDRMGMGGKRFKMWKFRSMAVAPEAARPHDAPLEQHRITPLGRFMRKYRVDELPNFWNVLVGDMSLVGPRPDAWDHAAEYLTQVNQYSERFRVRPGITGLAQVYMGYADTARGVKHKAYLDKLYITRVRTKLDLWILWRTVHVVMTGFGGR